MNLTSRRLGLLASLFSLLVYQSECYLYPYGPANPVPGTPTGPGSVWPRPLYTEESSEIFRTLATMEFGIRLIDRQTGEPMNCPTLDFAVNHYMQLIRNLTFAGNHIQEGAVSTLTVELLRCPPGVDYPVVKSPSEESYFVEVGDENVRISAITPWGVLRGMESFYQMIWSPADTYETWVVNMTQVADEPRFLHRGVMIDTARHYLPERLMVKILTALMYNKFNVLHWHIVDDQSFPYVSREFPELSQQGAYNEAEIYTPDAVARIIEAARVRGIRVILEFDTPGHTAALGISHPDLLTPCYGDGVHPGTPNYPKHAAYENLDPTNEDVYVFMKQLFSEIVNVTRDSHIHLGMDEAYPACWESSPLIAQFMRDNNYTKISQVQGHYVKRHVEMVKSLGAQPIAWHDPLDEGIEIDKDVIIQMWKNWGTWKQDYKRYVESGWKLIFSSDYYINYIAYGEQWKTYYESDPIHSFNITQDYRQNVIGGEAAIWGEFVDQTNIVARLFPAASAVASVLWDSKVDSDFSLKESTDNAAWRLDNFRCSLLRRKIQAQPILNGHCGPFEVDIAFDKRK